MNVNMNMNVNVISDHLMPLLFLVLLIVLIGLESLGELLRAAFGMALGWLIQ